MSYVERFDVNNGINAGAAGTANVQVLTVQGIAGMTPVAVNLGLTTTGGALYLNVVAPATPVANTIKSSAGNIYGIVAFNLLATPVYLKIFDVSGAVTLGTTAATFQYMIPGNTGGAGFVIQIPGLRSCANAIKYAITGGIAATDNTSITASSVIVDVTYN